MGKIAEIIDDKTIYVYDKSQFDWFAIRNCGQIFCDPPCDIINEVDKITIKAKGGKDSEWLWYYFDLGADYDEVKTELLKYDALKKPIQAGQGIRILRQPFHQTVVSFIISANNNIKRFSKTIEQIDFDNLGKYSEEDFKRMGCGYRAPYLVKTIAQLKELDIYKLNNLDNNSLRKVLMFLHGVGRKVADCILLFAFHRLDVAPVDTWIKKAIEQLGAENTDAILNDKYAGVAQQYIFYYLQHLHRHLN